MARSSLTSISNDLVNDGGGVLWSFVKGEQLEFPITLNFITDASLNYVYEAVLLEALNTPGQISVPSEINPTGQKLPLTVIKPATPSAWSAVATYSYGDVVNQGSKYYKLIVLTGNEQPGTGAKWLEINLNDISIRFPSTLSTGWAQQPTIGTPVYAFFELSVTEPLNPADFRRTWKPIRGVVEILFSPTDVVP